eukprot:TRINITY_DN23520_c0_g1_i1.p1 TRINITY_DN23520_c0_g1~~TRINITY_DN23520_c0_g1_i1.p1  ORF type:complete len:160 (+),score=21.78 TRINITY_DN23520_c0_g1_i1:289-768(+)
MLMSASQKWLVDRVPRLDHAAERLLYACCKEPDLWRFFNSYLAYRGVTTWQTAKALHRRSATLRDMPGALIARLLQLIQEVERPFGPDPAAIIMAPPSPPSHHPAARSSYSLLWVPAALHWIGNKFSGLNIGAAAHPQQTGIGIGDIELSKCATLKKIM